ncbi:hypothetical protein ABZ468_03045 [Streptomyces sp. NPDC005708]|uniref:hypothetical protein n=1 Tax=Streptomyces sp. NPDC005708 TaxID=3154564 RepID=UPI0033CFDF7A
MTSNARPWPQEYVPSRLIGPDPDLSVVLPTWADPTSSVRSVARASAATVMSALSTALAAVFAPSVPHADVTISAATVTPAQAAVGRSLIRPTPPL